MLEYQLIRSNKRKTIALQVKQGKVIVRSPSYVSQEYIANFIDEKSDWLKEKVHQQSLKKTSNELITLTDNSYFWFDGEKLRIQISFSNSFSVLPTTEELLITLPQKFQSKSIAEQVKYTKHKLENWLKQIATDEFIESISTYSQALNLQPSNLKIRQYKARWGSCNSKGHISLNYLLMMTPIWVRDYVVVHELCHLAFLNHSKDFWSLVESHYPETKAAKKWLKDHQEALRWPII